MSHPELVKKLRAVMPDESTIDLQAHAEIIAVTVMRARETNRAFSLAAAKRPTPLGEQAAAGVSHE